MLLTGKAAPRKLRDSRIDKANQHILEDSFDAGSPAEGIHYYDNRICITK